MSNSRSGSADIAARRGPSRMQAPVERGPDAGKTLKRLLSYLRPWRAQVVGSLVLIMVSVFAGLSAPWLQGLAIDEYVTNKDRSGLAQIVLVLIVAYVVSWAASFVYSRTIATVAQRAMADMRKALARRLQSLSMNFFDQNPTGDLMSRVTNDVDSVDQLMSQNLQTMAWAVTQIVALLTIMFVLDWRLTLAALIPVPLVLFGVARLGKRSAPAFGKYAAGIGKLNTVAEETLSGQRTVIAFDRQGAANAEFATINESTRDQAIKAQSLTAVMMPIMFGLGNLSTASVVGVGAWLAISDRGVTIGTIAAFVTYAGRVGQPLGRISSTTNSVFTALAGGRRIFELLDEEPDLPDRPDAKELPAVVGRVCFDKVDFSYVKGEPILADMSFVAEPGQMIGLVGPTGAGKSTIINVLNRFYDIDSGLVTVDGYDISAVKKDSLRDQLGVVLQRTYLFTGTVAENIRFGRLDATADEVVAAAKLANADRFIRSLPRGYHTVISERGTNLSVGQRQLIAIARTALADPAMLILDEATSSVDTRTERALQSALLNLMDGRTSFVIAHRLSTIRDADKILVIVDGEIAEAGSHDELVGTGGEYDQLYQAQFRGR